LKKIEYTGLEEGSLSPSEFMMRLFSLPGEPDTHYGYAVDWESNSYVFNKVEIENNKNTRFEMPEFDKLKAYRIELIMNGEPAGGIGPSLYISTSMDKVVLSSEIANEFYVLAKDEQTLKYIAIQSSLTPNRRKEYTVNQVESIEALSEHFKKSLEDINFSKPVWDNENRIFYRFSILKDF
jgi:hypothetical protein